MVTLGAYSDQETPTQVITPEGKIGTVIDNEKIFEVDTIKDYKKKSGKRYFLVSWKGYDSSEDTWEPEENIYFDPSECLPIIEAIRRRKAEERKQKRHSKNSKNSFLKPDLRKSSKESVETLSSELENDIWEKSSKFIFADKNTNEHKHEQKNDKDEQNSKQDNSCIQSDEVAMETQKVDLYCNKEESSTTTNFGWNTFKENNKIEKLKHLKDSLKSSLTFKNDWKKKSSISPISNADDKSRKEKSTTVKIYSRDFRKTGLEDYKIPKLGTAGKRQNSLTQISLDYRNLFIPKNLIKKPQTPSTPTTPIAPLVKKHWSLIPLDNAIQPIEPGCKSEVKKMSRREKEFNKNFFMGMSFDTEEPNEFELFSDTLHQPTLIPLDLIIEKTIKEPFNQSQFESKQVEPISPFIIPSIIVQTPEIYDTPTNSIPDINCDILPQTEINGNKIENNCDNMETNANIKNWIKTDEISENKTMIEKNWTDIKMEEVVSNNQISFDFIEKILKKVNEDSFSNEIKQEICISPSISDEIIEIPDTPASPDPEPIEEDEVVEEEFSSIIFPTRGKSRFDIDDEGKPIVDNCVPPPTIVDFGWMAREQEEKFSQLINFLGSSEEKDYDEETISLNSMTCTSDKYSRKKDRMYTVPYVHRDRRLSSSKNLPKHSSDHRIYEHQNQKKHYRPKLRSPSRSSSTSSLKWKLCVDD